MGVWSFLIPAGAGIVLGIFWLYDSWKKGEIDDLHHTTKNVGKGIGYFSATVLGIGSGLNQPKKKRKSNR